MFGLFISLPNSFTTGILIISPKIPVVVELTKKVQKHTISGRLWKITAVKIAYAKDSL